MDRGISLDFVIPVMSVVKFVFMNELRPVTQAKVTELSHKIHSTNIEQSGADV